MGAAAAARLPGCPLPSSQHAHLPARLPCLPSPNSPSPLQVADGYRPPILDNVPASVAGVIESCWKGPPDLRPSAREVVARLEAIQAAGHCSASLGGGGAQGGCCAVM